MGTKKKNKNPKIKQEGNKVGTRTPKLDKKEFQVWYIDYYFYKECRTLRMVTVQNGKKNTKVGQEPEETGNKKEQEPQSKTRMGQSRPKWEQSCYKTKPFSVLLTFDFCWPPQHRTKSPRLEGSVEWVSVIGFNKDLGKTIPVKRKIKAGLEAPSSSNMTSSEKEKPQ